MEFHIARTVREKLNVDGLLFSYTGNAIFANVAASRRLAAQLNDLRGPGGDTAKTVNAGALFAMGMIDELNHALIERYRKDIDPEVHAEALRWFAAKIGQTEVDRLLLTFVEQFPNVSVYRGEETAANWLKGSSDGMPNREAALEELMLLWLTNINPAFAGFRELFDDKGLQMATQYPNVVSDLPEYLETRPPVAPEIGSLYAALTAPIAASPDSITGQLEFIREKWPAVLGEGLGRVLLAIDTLREEEIAVWMRFNPPSPEKFGHAAPTWGNQGFVGDEFVGFDDDFIIGPGGVRQRRYAHDYQAPLNEYEAFSSDQAWMPNVVLMAKSTYVWLEQLSKKYGRHIYHLDHIPDEELRLLADRGITGLWLIGLWERSIASKTIKRLRGHSDAVASAYSLKEYNIAEDLGGGQAYASLRDRSARYGIRLASDMVPNHMGIDSPWVIEHPEWFLSRPESPFPAYQFNGPDISQDSRAEIKIEDHYYDQTDAAVVFRLKTYRDGATRFVYHGNDGTSFAWNDTAQLDYSRADVREYVIQTILHVARQFPIIRFDAAMVLAKRHIQRLWFPLPGAGGSIPSRAEDAVSQERFDAMVPHEFWREVVDRVATEVPGTLLLAEAFWLLEGYFVRTLGMHRVYNSAFMNMLRDEENAKYRSYLKKTIEFDTDILKRYVNFMSNPDEKTAIDQFGNGDKYFGVTTLLSTLPGLPMFGHGQIEGFTERYGMEFKQARMDERPDEALMARHQHDIAPLLKNRRLFAESAHFLLYDFWTDYGTVDENVFAYSNRLGGERSLIFYNNRYGETEGSIHVSSAWMDKTSNALKHTSLSEGLGLPLDGSVVLAYRDLDSGLEHLRRATDFQHHGMRLSLRGYQCVVMLHWRELRSTGEQPWDELCDTLGGRGVHSVDEALSLLRLRPLHEALSQAIHLESAAEFAAASTAQEIPDKKSTKLIANEAKALTSEEATNKSVPATDAPGISAVSAIIDDKEVDAPGTAPVLIEATCSVPGFLAKSEAFFAQLSSEVSAALLHTQPMEITSDTKSLALSAAEQFAEECAAKAASVVKLPALQMRLADSWPANLPLPLANPTAQAWAPVLAWVVLSSIPTQGRPADVVDIFDRLRLRTALAEIFSSFGIEGDVTWRTAAKVRALLALAGASTDATETDAFWADPDARWLAGINEAAGKTYLNKERFEELLGWLQLPELLSANGNPRAIQNVADNVAQASEAASDAGYELSGYLARLRGEVAEEPNEDSAVVAEAAIQKI